MAPPDLPSPEKLTLLRIISLAASTLIALSAGTNYVYSAYAPQLGERLNLSAKQINLIGTAGNLGMYVTGIPSGLLVDRRGPRLPILLGAVTMFLGYYPIWRAMKNAPVVEPQDHPHADATVGNEAMVAWLAACMVVNGGGSSFAFAGALKTAAMNWPRHRGSATAVVLAAFGLSAFFFSSLAAWLFPGNTEGFLGVLTTVTSAVTALGFFFCRIVPVGRGGGYSGVGTGKGKAKEEDDKSWAEEEVDRGTCAPVRNGGPSNEDVVVADERTRLVKEDEEEGKAVEVEEHEVDVKRALVADIRGWELCKNVDFWYLFTIMGCLAGAGLMTINNVGHDAQALWNHFDPHTPPSFIQTQQSLHVSLISLTSFTGRLASGILSDILIHRFQSQRCHLLILSSVISVLAQISALYITNPHHLFILSSLSGLAYGMLFGVCPTIVGEYFSIQHMSTNWGALTMGAVVGGNVGNMAYGVVFDRHSEVLGSGRRECSAGVECYRGAYWVTLAMAVVGGLASWGVVRRNRHLAGKH